ncbi:hypothetical protein MRX96_016744 [Rhipicephalus microplus]
MQRAPAEVCDTAHASHELSQASLAATEDRHAGPGTEVASGLPQEAPFGEDAVQASSFPNCLPALQTPTTEEKEDVSRRQKASVDEPTQHPNTPLGKRSARRLQVYTSTQSKMEVKIAETSKKPSEAESIVITDSHFNQRWTSGAAEAARSICHYAGKLG